MDRGMRQHKGVAILHALMRSLDISREDAGTMFGVTGEMVVRWENGREEIPELVFARLIGAQTALGRLLEIFRPDRLPQVVRRRADAFGGERALDWILDGRVAEVADRYEQGLAYMLPRSA